MSVQIKTDGFIIDLFISGYRKSNKNNWDEQWCRCDLGIRFKDSINYQIPNSEVLLSCEVEELEESLSKLLDNELTEKKIIEPIEPDFKFLLYPQEDLRNNPNYTYVQPGYEIQDIYLEWRVYFWSDGLTDNYLTVMLGREEITVLRDYLRTVIKK